MENHVDEGYDYGGQLFRVGAVVKILEHLFCSHDEGVVGVIKNTLPPSFYIACAKCLRKGMIPDIRVFWEE